MNVILFAVFLLLSASPPVNAQERDVIEKICQATGVHFIVEPCGDYIVTIPRDFNAGGVISDIMPAGYSVYDLSGKSLGTCSEYSTRGVKIPDFCPEVYQCGKHYLSTLNSAFEGDLCEGIPVNCDLPDSCKNWNKYIRKVL